MKILNVLYQTDDNYAPIAGVSMTSLFETNKHLDEIHVYMLDDGISKENLEKYQTLCEQYGRDLTVIDTKPIEEKLKSYGVGTFRNVYTVYFTMFVMNDLSLKTDRIFKLDADTIVKGPLDELCAFDFRGNYLAATYDCTLNSYKPMVGLTPDDPYFNAGIILFNQKAWIDNQCQQQLIDHIHEGRSKYYLCEQDLMNVVFRGHIAVLPIRFNLNSGFYIFGAEQSYKLYQLNPYAYSPLKEIKEAMEHPVILHLMGAMTGRPWEKKNTHPQKKEFREVLDRSLWSGFVLPTPKRSVVFKIQKFLHAILQDWAYIPIHRMMNYRFLKQQNEEAIKTSDVYDPKYINHRYYGKEYTITKPLNILYQANEYYAPYLGISLLSLLDRNKHIKEIRIFIIDDGIAKETREKIEQLAGEFGRSVVYLDTAISQKLLEEANAPKFRGNYATYFKLFVLDELPEDVETILYVDSDTIIRGALDAVTEFDFDGHALAMVPAIYHNKYRAKVGIPEEYLTYNAGIMAFHLSTWRKNQCRERLIKGMQEDPKVLTFAPDQSLAIKVLQEDLAQLPLNFNFSTLYSLFGYEDISRMFRCREADLFTQDVIDDAYRNIVIYHFIELQVGKPWEKDSVHPKKFLWQEYYEKSPWSDLPAPTVKLSPILKLQRITYKLMPKRIYMAAYAFAWKYLMK